MTNMASFVSPSTQVLSEKEFPVPTAKKTLTHGDDDDLKTEIIVQNFADRYMVVVSQLEKLGTVKVAEAIEGPEGRRTYEVSTLLGKRDDPLLDIYARQLIERSAAGTAEPKPLLLAIALKESGRGVDIFNEVLNTVIELAAW